MANGGWYGTQREWDLAEQPLPALDPALEEFAAIHAFRISKNAKDWPERSLKKDMPLSSLLQIFRVDLEMDSWKVWAVCSEDRVRERFWKQAIIADGVTGDQLSASLVSLLERGLDRLLEWNECPQDFEFATKLGDPP